MQYCPNCQQIRLTYVVEYVDIDHEVVCAVCRTTIVRFKLDTITPDWLVHYLVEGKVSYDPDST